MMRTRTVVASVLAVVLGLFVGVAPTIGGQTTPTTSSSSGGCIPPTLGVDTWIFAFPSSRGASEDRERDCDILCRSHMRKCHRVVRLSRTCNSGFVGTFAQLLQDVCRTETDDQSRRDCRSETRALRIELRDCVKLDAQQADQCCENNLQACLDDCNDVKNGPPARCFTGGTCLFDFFNSTVNSTF